MLTIISTAILPLLILFILGYGLFKKVPIYEEFVEGAKDGFKVSVSIIPYLVALIVAIGMLRASGIMESLSSVLGPIFSKLGIHTDLLPIMITRPLSGSATLGLFSDLVSNYGADNYLTKLAAIMVGSSETTFYVLSVYCGSVGIKKFRYAVLTGVLADIISIVLAILVARYFFLSNIG